MMWYGKKQNNKTLTESLQQFLLSQHVVVIGGTAYQATSTLLRCSVKIMHLQTGNFS